MIIKIFTPFFLVLLSIFITPLSSSNFFLGKEQFEGKITYHHSKTSSKFDGMLDAMQIQEDSISIWAISKNNLVAKYINKEGYINETYVKMGDDGSFIYYPDSEIIDYDKLPNATNYIYKKTYKEKEEILGIKCTKHEYALGKETKVFFWVADNIKLKNHGEFFNFISKKNHLVLKRQLIWGGEGNTYEAIKIEKEVKDEDFIFLY